MPSPILQRPKHLFQPLLKHFNQRGMRATQPSAPDVLKKAQTGPATTVTCSVYSIPAELLIEILAFLPLVCQPDELCSTSIYVSHVNTTWRVVALSHGCKALWATLSTGLSRSGIETFVSRSDPLPMSLYLSRARIPGTSVNGVCSDLLVVHAHRFKRVAINGRLASKLLDDEWKNISSVSPTSLALSSFTPYLSNKLPWRAPISSLRRVSLVRTSINAEHPILRSSLTSLSIEKSRVGTSTETLLQALSRMPQLQELTLSLLRFYGQRDEDPSAHRQPRSVELSQLRKCVLHGYGVEVASVFRHLSLPLDVVLNFVLEYDDITPDSQEITGQAEFCTAVSAHIVAAHEFAEVETPFSEIALKVKGANFTLTASGGTRDAPRPLISFHVRRHDYSIASNGTGFHDSALSALLGIPSFSKVERLSFSRHSNTVILDTNDIVLRQLRDVRELVLEDPHRSSRAGHGTLFSYFLQNPFPKVVRIEARQCLIPTTPLSPFLAMLHIVLIRCAVKRSFVEQLRDACARVDWDGVEVDEWALSEGRDLSVNQISR
ncbi:hypothetical protein K488DRAFT_83385 [Vararia minispora EC-137]|uniref:Uncharacterized protein n=1 Tax=Vararia minispora EC-137 TaxID=1314806 RepID=A0ACB8QT88_9AGAM|nr:hypothetical protein K488DRAFT_83385 [Vararia minispora EC-137]